MATLIVATVRHHHMNRVSGDTYNLKYLSSPAKKREMRELQCTSMNGTQSKLYILTQLASKTDEP